MTQSFWADEANVEALKAYWAEGLSCSQISRAFGWAVTRNAIIGKVSRLGLPGRATSLTIRGHHQKQRSASRPKPFIVKEPQLSVVEEEPVTLQDGSHVTIMTVTDQMCRWPIGDPAATNFHFCGRAPRPGAPYCEAHARKAYQPALTAASRKKGEANEANRIKTGFDFDFTIRGAA
jgi:GcrA cell cycle regulator